MFRRYDSDEYRFSPSHMSASILAYLILPSIQSTLKTSPGPETVSFMSSMVLDPSVVQEPSLDRKTHFKAVLKTMQLKPWVIRDADNGDGSDSRASS